MSFVSNNQNNKPATLQAEGLFNLISKCSNEAQKRKLCTVLIELFQSIQSYQANFADLIISIDDLNKCKHIECRTIWVEIMNEIIRFDSQYKQKYRIMLLKHIFCKDFINDSIKKKTMNLVTKNYSDFTLISKEMIINIIQYLTFNCLLINNENETFCSLYNCLNSVNSSLINYYLLDFIIECCCMIAMMNIDIVFDLRYKLSIDENQKLLAQAKDKLLLITNIFKVYLNFPNQRKNKYIEMIIVVLCYYVNLNYKTALDILSVYEYNNSQSVTRILFNLLHKKLREKYLSKLFNQNVNDNEQPDGQTYNSTNCFIHSFDEEAMKEGQNIYESFIKRYNTKLFEVNNQCKIITGVLCFINNFAFKLREKDKNDLDYDINESWGLECNLHRLLDILLDLDYDKDIMKHVLIILSQLIKQYGRIMMLEWDSTFKILMKYNNNELSTKFLYEEIINHILFLELNGHFKGNIEDLNKILSNMQAQVLPLVMFSKLKLDFEIKELNESFEQIFIEYLGTITNNQMIFSFFINMLQKKYVACNDQSSLLILERLIKENLFTMIEAFSPYEELLLKFSNCISTIANLSLNMSFFKEIIIRLLTISDKSSLEFRDISLRKIIYYLNIRFNQEDKMKIFLEVLISNSHSDWYSKKDHENEKKIIKCLITLFNNFTFNQSKEIIISLGNHHDKFNNKTQTFLINNFTLNNQMFSLENIYDYYSPYIVIQYDHFFKFFISYMNKEYMSLRVCEDIITFLNKQLSLIYFYKGIQVDILINTILNFNTKSFTKIFLKTSLLQVIIQLLINLCYHMNTLMIQDNTSYTNDIAIDNKDLKEKILLYAIDKLTFFNQLILQSNLIVKDSNGISFSQLKKCFKLYLSLTETYLVSLMSKTIRPAFYKTLNSYCMHIICICTQVAFCVLKNKFSLCFNIISFFYMTKDFMAQLDEEVNITIIFLITSIIWRSYSLKIFSSFTSHYKYIFQQYKRDSDDSYRINQSKRPLLKQWLWFFGQSTLMYYISKISSKETIKLIYSNLLNSKHKKDSVFLELLYWNIDYSNKSRNELWKDNNVDDALDTQSFLMQSKLITIIKRSEELYDIIIRSFTSAIKISISKEQNYINDIHKKTIEDLLVLIDCLDPELMSKNQEFDNLKTNQSWKVISILSSSNNQEIIKPLPNSNLLNDYINTLDTIPVYETYYCNIDYISSTHSNCLVNELNEYITLLTFIGNISFISINSNDYLQISYQDIMFNIILRTSLTNSSNPSNYQSHLASILQFNQKEIIKAKGTNQYTQIQLIYLTNLHNDYSSLLFESTVLVYVLISPISSSHYILRIKYNISPNYDKIIQSIKSTIESCLPTEISLIIDEGYYSIKHYLISMISLIQMIITYTISKIAYGNKMISDVVYDTTIEQRYALFKKLKQSNVL